MSILASIIGNITEWYDFTLFVSLAPVIAHQFFPKEQLTTALLSTFLIFAMGFFIRPLGALIFGHIGDSYGRISSIKITILILSIATMGIGLLPTYGQIGIFAPFLLAFLRIVQGLCLGGEFAGTMIYLTEISPNTRRALISCMTNNGSNLGVLGAAGLSFINK